MPPTKLLGALGAGLIALGVSAPAHAATFAVNTTASAGAGSLRSAINAANATVAADTIEFAIPGNGVHTITPVVPLPQITEEVLIDGYTQPGSSPAAAGVPAVPTIVINASNSINGLDIFGDDVEVRGVVVRNAQVNGIHILGSRNVLAGNYIGLNAAGVAASPNGAYGVHIDGGVNNRIGGPLEEDRNVIASNPSGEVFAHAGNSQRVEGNYLGLDETGAVGIGGGGGVRLVSDLNVVEDNVIAFELAGVQVEGDDNTVRANKVGTDRDGDSALPNFEGVNVFGGDRNVIEDNLASGNFFSGVQLVTDNGDPAEDNEVANNDIGTNAAGTAAVPNGTGVTINASNDNTLTDNVVAGNSGDGVQIRAAGADDNRLEGNTIGLLDLGNGGSGVEIDGGDQNHVGDPGNTIAYNGSDGIDVLAGVGNAIRKNSIHDNHGLGIDLGANGPTPNDPDDPDTGPNQLQNDPEIDDATSTSVDWSLDSAPLTSYRLDFFANDECDRTGSGEGQTFLDSITVSTNANGDVDGSTVTAIAAGAGKQVSMTATELAGVASRSTSEFSPCEATS